jgi:hypothetical protein
MYLRAVLAHNGDDAITILKADVMTRRNFTNTNIGNLEEIIIKRWK